MSLPENTQTVPTAEADDLAPKTEPTIWDRLTVQPDDSKGAAALKIASGIGIGIALLIISPLILLGIFVGLFAVA